jgi:hypothetical protein
MNEINTLYQTMLSDRMGLKHLLERQMDPQEQWIFPQEMVVVAAQTEHKRGQIAPKASCCFHFYTVFQ